MADINPAGTPATAQTSDKPFGPVGAAFLASAVGAVVLGILTTLAEANEDINSFLEFNARVGPLAGKTLIAVGAFLRGMGGAPSGPERKGSSPAARVRRHRDLVRDRGRAHVPDVLPGVRAGGVGCPTSGRCW